MGNEAVYHLLSWLEGNFEVRDVEALPRQTITTSWNHLVLEEMRRAAERRRSGEAEPVEPLELSEAEIEEDDVLENQVILLLSKLEQLLARLSDVKDQKKPAHALETLTQMVNQLAEFTHEHLYLEVLPDIVSMVTGGNSTTDLLQINNNQLMDTKFLLGNDQKDEPENLVEVKRQIFQSLIKISEKFILLITNSFHSSSVGDRWRVTCGEFITNLTAVVEQALDNQG